MWLLDRLRCCAEPILSVLGDQKDIAELTIRLVEKVRSKGRSRWWHGKLSVERLRDLSIIFYFLLYEAFWLSISIA